MDWAPAPPQRPSIDRVKAYLGFSGTQVCLDGLAQEGTGADFGTFPRTWPVAPIIGSPCWIEVLKCPKKNERPKAGVHYTPIEPLSWRPKAVVFHTTCPPASLVTVPDDVIGYVTDYISVLDTEVEIPYEEPEEYADDDKINTPETPPPSVSPRGIRRR